ncbi:glucokinase [Rhizobium sp. AC27/96]|uniref:ROK family protein n=1 Tax=Rhizobium sp. AC27/96 TaxID=1841653 RepID=UPI0008277349|nr:ROK family protein [Rhizobium sp. AC27/96]OCJ00614.1 glucokinase [Rhizobium sp. AC27/96]
MSRFAIGIDLGGTQVRAALVDELGNVLQRVEDRTDADAGPDPVLGQIGSLTDRLLLTCDPGAIVGIGVSAPGPLDTETGTALEIPTLRGFSNYPLRQELQKRLRLPVRLENDGIAAAIGEWQFGAGRGIANLVYVTVSTGIGGGAIADGRVVRGRKGMAGHVGHMSIAPDGIVCPCGNKGCFEAYASGTAFAKRARTRATECSETLLAQNGEVVDSRSIFAAAAAGDPLANSLVDEEAEILGRGFTNLIHIFSPEIVIMGGGLSDQFDRLRPGIQSHVSQWAMPAFRDVEVVRAALGQNSGLIGAAALAFIA